MNSNEIIANFFASEFPLNREGLDEFLGAFETQTYEKNSMLLLAGKSESKMRFLCSGIVREYYASNGRETNINFYTSPQFITDYTSFSQNSHSKKYQQTLTKVEIKSIGRAFFLDHLQRHDCGRSVVEETFKRLLIHKETIEYNRITKSPEELYHDVLEKKPHWLLKIPQYHIASYLGITPETLSRIRNRIS